MQKNSKDGQVSKKNCFPPNNLKSLKICSKHYLSSFSKKLSNLEISGPYLSKMKLAIFEKISDPGYAKKFKKHPKPLNLFFKKNLFCSK